MALVSSDDQGLVGQSLAQWTYRFVSAGIPLSDLERLAREIDDWLDWCEGFAELGHAYEGRAETAIDAGNDRTAGAHYRRASMCYHFGSHVWHEDAEARNDTHRCAVRAFSHAGELLEPRVRRLEAPYEGFDVPGLLRVPDGAPEGLSDSPLVILLPGLDSIKEELEAYAASLRSRGLATLAVDGAGQGETWYEQGMTPEYPATISAMVDHVRSVNPPGVDTRRLGVYGVSLGGFYAPSVAANDGRFDACVSVSGPFTVGPVSRWEGDLLREQFLWACKTDSMIEVDRTTEAMTLRGEIDRLTAPTLALTGARDSIVPPAQTERIAERASNGEFRCYENGTHVCNNIPQTYRPDAADWLRATLVNS